MIQKFKRLVYKSTKEIEILVHSEDIDSSPFTNHGLPETSDIFPRKLFCAEFKKLHSTKLQTATIALRTFANSSWIGGLSDIQNV